MKKPRFYKVHNTKYELTHYVRRQRDGYYNFLTFKDGTPNLEKLFDKAAAKDFKGHRISECILTGSLGALLYHNIKCDYLEVEEYHTKEDLRYSLMWNIL
jgi:hypothetical protein